ncbi:MAG: hypothetical protein U0900_14260 [Myxococcota bacterium]
MSDFKRAIRTLHGAYAMILGCDFVDDRLLGEPGRRGGVFVFELIGHPTASKCFVWEIDGEITTVLAEGPVKTAADAVRASIKPDCDDPGT